MSKIQTGRNLPVATLVGLLLISLVIASLYINKYAFIAVALSALLLAAWEISAQWAKLRNIKVSFFLIALSITLMAFAAVIYGIQGLIIAYILSILLNVIFAFVTRNKSSFKKIILISIFIVSYLGLFGSLSMLMLKTETGASRVFLFIAITALSDTGGYFTGILFGKHKIASSISPNKSYEGLIGSIVFAGIFSALVAPALLNLSITQSIVLGITLAVSGTIGDLFESRVKRKIGIKDFSTIIPGHGGMVDRLDSLAPNAFMSSILFGLFLGFH